MHGTYYRPLQSAAGKRVPNKLPRSIRSRITGKLLTIVLNSPLNTLDKSTHHTISDRHAAVHREMSTCHIEQLTYNATRNSRYHVKHRNNAAANNGTRKITISCNTGMLQPTPVSHLELLAANGAHHRILIPLPLFSLRNFQVRSTRGRLFDRLSYPPAQPDAQAHFSPK